MTDYTENGHVDLAVLLDEQAADEDRKARTWAASATYLEACLTEGPTSAELYEQYLKRLELEANAKAARAAHAHFATSAEGMAALAKVRREAVQALPPLPPAPELPAIEAPSGAVPGSDDPGGPEAREGRGDESQDPKSADDWNDRFPVGTLVRYWPAFRGGPGVVSRTSTPAWLLGSGHAVVSVEGYSGGIALSHVEPRPEGEEDAPPSPGVAAPLAEVAAPTGPHPVVPDVPYVDLVGQQVTVHLLDGAPVTGVLMRALGTSLRVGDGDPIPMSRVQLVVPDREMPKPPPPPPSLAAVESKKPITTHHDPIVLPGDLAEGPRHEKPAPPKDSNDTGTFRAIVDEIGDFVRHPFGRREGDGTGQDGDGHVQA